MYNENDDLNLEMQNDSNPGMDNDTEPEQSSLGVHKPADEMNEAGPPESYGAGTGGAYAGGADMNNANTGSSYSNSSNYRSADTTGHSTYGWEQRRAPELDYSPKQTYDNSHNNHRNAPRRSLGRKAAGITAAALLFGTVAGGTMFGVNSAADYLLRDSSVASQEPAIAESIPPAETQPEVSVPVGQPRVSTALAMDVSDIVEKAMPSVVAINNTMLYNSQDWFGQRQTYEVPSSGSGIIVGQNANELLIVTNNHVVADSKNLSVTFIDNSSVEAAIKGTDSETDLAVIAVPLDKIESDTMNQINVATLGDSDALKVGQGVIAIGNALGYGQSVTVGYVSALDREVKTERELSRNLLQTDAAINPGNSGGALLNMKGEVIGINAAKYSSTEVEGMGYAIPISKAQDIINELMNKKTRVEVAVEKQGYLGLQGQNIDETAAEMYGMPRGVYVFKIVEGGAAAGSDLKEKDIITKFDGQIVRTMADLKEMLTYYEAGDMITLTVQSLQDGQYVERPVEITLGNRPEAETN